LHNLSAKSNAVLAQIGTGVQWVQSYVTGNRLFCVYNAENEEKIREHARIGGFPCDEITQVSGIIDPVTGEDQGSRSRPGTTAGSWVTKRA
jgi:hypothetical protein